MPPTSLPVVPPQPADASYGFNRLHLFHTFSRDSYFGVFGVQAPPADVNRPLKGWFDTSVAGRDPSETVTYLVEDPKGKDGMSQLIISVADAMSVNLPGNGTYPLYMVAPTPAMSTLGGSMVPMNDVADLSTPQDAQMMAALLKTAPPVEVGEGSIVWNGEMRRRYAVTVNGEQYFVGRLLSEMNTNGIGAPGHWDLTSAPKWVPAAEPDWSSMSAWGQPIRPLLSNETVVPGPLGMGFAIAKNVAIPNTSPSSPAQDSFTALDRSMLRTIFTWVEAQQS